MASFLLSAMTMQASHAGLTEEDFAKFDAAIAKLYKVEKIRRESGETTDYITTLNKILHGQDISEMRKAGLLYLQGTVVDQDLEKAALLLAVAHRRMVREEKTRASVKEILMKGYAAHSTAIAYSDKKDDDYNLERSRSFHHIAGMAGSQKSLIASGYLSRFQWDDSLARYDSQNTIHNELMYFDRAASCNDDNVNRKIMPFDIELCKAASEEHAATAKRFNDQYANDASKNSSAIWAAMVLVGLSVLAADIGGSAGDSYESYEPYKMPEPNDLEIIKFINP